MKGDIFNIFEDFISETWDVDTYEKIYEGVCPHMKTKDPFVGPGTYPDGDFMLLVEGACKEAGLSIAEGVKAFGVFSFPKLIGKMPNLVKEHIHPKTLLQVVDSVIHVEVRKLYPDASLPVFKYEDPAQDRLIMIYSSKRKLYDFVEGLIEGASIYYKIPITVRREIITNEMDESCRFDLTFGS